MKRTPKLLLMILLLLVLVSLCLVVRSCDGDEEEPPQQVIYDASDIDGESMTAMTVTNGNGSFAFQKKGESWVLSEAPELQIQSDVVATLAQNIIDVTGTNRIDNVTDLSQYGLSEPEITITVTDKNGDETYRIGDLNGIIEAYYFCSEQYPTFVFTVDSSVCESFEFAISELLVLDFPQPPEADSISSVRFGTDEGSILYTAISRFLYNDEEQISDDNPSGAVYSHTATKTVGDQSSDYSYAEMYRLAQAVAAIKPSGDYFYTEADNQAYFSSYTPVTVTYTVKEAMEADSAAGGYVEKEKTLTYYLCQAEDSSLYAKPDVDSPLIYKLTENDLWDFAK